MGYPAPTPQYIGPPNNHGAENNTPIDRIVIHCTVSPCCTGAGSIATMFKNTSRNASAHYVVDAKTEVQALYDSVVGFHAPPNRHALGIELCCSLGGEGKGHWSKSDHQKMLRRAARLTAQLCLHHEVPIQFVDGAGLRAGKRGITGHANVRDAWHQTTHWDPGPYFPWTDFIRLVKEEAASLATQPTTNPITPTLKDDDDMSLRDQLIPRWSPLKGFDGKTQLDAAQQLNQARGFAESAYTQATAARGEIAEVKSDLDEIKALLEKVAAHRR